MPAKKNQKLNTTKEVKRLARERIGTVPPSRVEEEKGEKRRDKHKKALARMDSDEIAP